jgi:hypothetical protein
MLLVVFGAGASFDSSPTHPLGIDGMGRLVDDAYRAERRPPLAKELFANRPIFATALDSFPQCKTIVPWLRQPQVMTGQRSVEAVLSEIEDQANSYSRGKIELAAVRCYLQRAINACQIQWREVTRGITNYLTLLREIDRMQTSCEPVVLVTFNYDNLLEDALHDLGHTQNQMADYVDESKRYRVFKLHGSVDWAQLVENELPANLNRSDPETILRHLAEHAAELKISNKFIKCHPSSMGLDGAYPVFPAIAIPVEKKNQFACPETFIEKLVELLPNISKILVIGWRATEGHFLTLLDQHLPAGVQICIVAGRSSSNFLSPAKSTIDSIYGALTARPPLQPEIYDGGFTDFLVSGHVRSVLNFT